MLKGIEIIQQWQNAGQNQVLQGFFPAFVF